MVPAWYGRRYPTHDDLLALADLLGAGVADAPVPFGLFFPDVIGVPVILLPQGAGPLERTWHLAHELGHLILHTGPRGDFLHGKDEAQADRWAAQALIPHAAVLRYRNASLDAFIGALSKHYEDIPFTDCPARKLAARIARIRLRTLEEVA